MNGAVLSEWSSERGVEEGGGRLKAGGRIFWQRIGEIIGRLWAARSGLGSSPVHASTSALSYCFSPVAKHR